MAKRSSLMLAVLFIANPFMLLFYQNCSSAPPSHAQNKEFEGNKKPASEPKVHKEYSGKNL